MTPAKREPVAEPDAPRRDALVATAAGLFVRFGFRKTSMDDVARAAKLSRQGLYFHFANKEALFRAVIEHLARVTLAAANGALERPDASLEERLVGAFTAMAADVLGDADRAAVQELFASASELVGDVVQELDRQIVAALANALKRERRARGGSGDIAPAALAEHLYAASYGLQHRGHSGKDYLDRMRVAVRLVCNNEGETS